MVGRSAHCGVCAYQGDSASADPGAWFRALPWEVRCLGIGWGLVPGSAHFLLCLRYGLCTPLATHQTKPSASQAARQGSLRQPACTQGVPGTGGGPGVIRVLTPPTSKGDVMTRTRRTISTSASKARRALRNCLPTSRAGRA